MQRHQSKSSRMLYLRNMKCKTLSWHSSHLNRKNKKSYCKICRESHSLYNLHIDLREGLNHSRIQCCSSYSLKLTNKLSSFQNRGSKLRGKRNSTPYCSLSNQCCYNRYTQDHKGNNYQKKRRTLKCSQCTQYLMYSSSNS